MAACFSTKKMVLYLLLEQGKWWPIIESYFWQDKETFVNDGIQMEPFNLEREREEGYFDEQGNYVEYVDENEIKVLHSVTCDFYPFNGTC